MKNASENPELSASHWWGFAAMPEGMEYPSNGEDNPLTLICQFHLGEGMVYVLADLDYFFGDIEAEGGHLGEWPKEFYKVLYSPTRENLHEHEIRYADGTSAVPEARPMNDVPPAPNDEMSREQGSLNGVWRDEIEQEYPGYEVLLQVDEDDEIGLRFYDCGTLFFLIKPEELEAREFENTKCVLYSY